jgi:hypothetical protein
MALAKCVLPGEAAAAAAAALPLQAPRQACHCGYQHVGEYDQQPSSYTC